MNLEPSSQINLFGHNKNFIELVNLYNRSKLPNKILLSGEKGVGKCTLAYHLINYILSFDEEHSYDLSQLKINPNNKSFKLTQNKSNPNFYLIDVTDEKKNIDINQIRNLILNLNKSSFNTKPRFVLIDNIELLNVNSVNALLKILEEPNDNINFILINNNKKILPTLKSRCLNFKIILNYEQSIQIINNILNEQIHDLLSGELINSYSTPGQLLKMIKFDNENEINLKDISIKELLSKIIKEKFYKKDTSMKSFIYLLIELYFRKKTSIKDIKYIDVQSYFLKKINDTRKFNLDEEALFMEFKDKVLNE